MRTALASVVVALVAGGCADRDSIDPGALLREELAVVASTETVSRVVSSTRTVRCACDADGDLHVHAPQGSRVLRIEDGSDAAAEIVLPDDSAPAPIRTTRSLGFIGDAKLGESRARGGPWAAPDALLPPHSHAEPRYGGYRLRRFRR